MPVSTTAIDPPGYGPSNGGRRRGLGVCILPLIRKSFDVPDREPRRQLTHPLGTLFQRLRG